MTWEFEKILYSSLLLLLPLLVWRMLYLYKWKKNATHNFADTNLQKRIFGNINQSKTLKEGIVIILIICSIILALMNPLGGKVEKKIKRAGIDIIFVVDLSNSMNAQDIAPSRLLKAKKIVTNIISQLGGDRMGIVIFAGQAYPVMPLSNDYEAGSIYINEISTNDIQNQGTDIADAITKASEMLSKTANTSKTIILISDGEAHKGVIDNATKIAEKENITIFSVGMGSSRGAPIPITHKNGYTEYKKDSNGNIITTRLNDYSLKKIAHNTKGNYFVGETYTNDLVNEIFSALSKLEKKEIHTNHTYESKQYFQIFIGIALLLLIIISLTNYKRDYNI